MLEYFLKSSYMEPPLVFFKLLGFITTACFTSAFDTDIETLQQWCVCI